MTTVFFHSLLFLFISYSHGLLFLEKLLKTKTYHNFFETSLIGLLITLTISPLINFFIPLNDILIIFNSLFLFIFFIFNQKFFFERIKLNNKVFLIVFFLVILNIYGSGFSDDLDHYHYGSITNSDEMNLIWGNSFLHSLYGTSSIWLTGHSYFNFDYSRLIDIHVLNGLILFLVLSLFLSEINLSKKKNFFFNKFLFILSIFIIIKYTRIKEFGIDRPAILIFCFLIYYYLKFFLVSQNNRNFDNYIILSLISITIISIKIIYLPILFLPFFVFLKQIKKNFKTNYHFLFLLFPIFVFLFKNLFSSGCLIFPLEFTCLNFLSWSNYVGSIEFSSFNEAFNKSWYSYSGNLSQMDYVNNFNWFDTWFDRGKIEIFEYLLTIIIICIITIYLFGGYSKNDIKIKSNLKILKISLILIIISSLMIYFLKNPVIRMNHHVLISIMITFTLFFTINKKKIKVKSFANYFLIIALFFNFYKNFERIYYTGFKNDPKDMVLHKINAPKKKILGDFVYYNGWYGNAPIGNQILKNKTHERKLIFNVISNK